MREHYFSNLLKIYIEREGGFHFDLPMMISHPIVISIFNGVWLRAGGCTGAGISHVEGNGGIFWFRVCSFLQCVRTPLCKSIRC